MNHNASTRQASRHDSAAFTAFYRRWNTVNALVLTVGSVLLAVGTARAATVPFVTAIAATVATVGPALALWSLGAMAVLFLAARRFLSDGTGPLAPNLLTGARALAAVAVLAGLPAAAGQAGQMGLVAGRGLAPATLMTITLVLAVVETTDYFDGRLARRFGPSEFGASWDMETDALFTLSLALLLRAVYGVGIFVVLIGLMRYLYVLLWRYVSDPITVPRAYKLFARTTAATIVVTMIVVLAPIVPPWLRTASLLLVLAMQSVSFGWDLLLQRQARR